MEDYIIILGIVMLIFGILQIILFFKLWGMTNNVRWIKRHLGKEEDQQRELMKAIHKGDPNLEQLLFDFAYSEFYTTYTVYFGMATDYYLERAKAHFSDDFTRVSVVYNKAGIAVPEIFSAIKSCKDFDTYFALPKE